MTDTREKYDREHAQTRAFFSEAVEVYRNDSIIIKDARGCFRPMQRPWPARPLDHVRGLFVHHRASWNSYEDMQKNVVLQRYKKDPAGRHDRIAYTYGVDHNPEVIDGLIVVYQFNNLGARSWHSGAPGRDSERFTDWRRAQGPGNSANQYTVGINLSGFFASRGYKPNHPSDPTAESRRRGVAKTLICHPSIEQCRAVWGLWQTIGGVGIFGHHDTGKAACPGNTASELVDAIWSGIITTDRELDRWLSGRDSYILPGGYPSPSDVYGDSAADQDIDYVTECQRMLVALGYDLGSYGPKRNGVDGDWGSASRIALIEFEEGAGLLTNGQPEKADYDALKAALEVTT
jgi:hypothetical protein